MVTATKAKKTAVKKGPAKKPASISNPKSMVPAFRSDETLTIDDELMEYCVIIDLKAAFTSTRLMEALAFQITHGGVLCAILSTGPREVDDVIDV